MLHGLFSLLPPPALLLLSGSRAATPGLQRFPSPAAQSTGNTFTLQLQQDHLQAYRSSWNLICMTLLDRETPGKSLAKNSYFKMVSILDQFYCLVLPPKKTEINKNASSKKILTYNILKKMIILLTADRQPVLMWLHLWI